MTACMLLVPCSIIVRQMLTENSAAAAAAIATNDQIQAGITLATLATVLVAPAILEGIMMILCIETILVAVADAEDLSLTISKIRSAIVGTVLGDTKRVAWE